MINTLNLTIKRLGMAAVMIAAATIGAFAQNPVDVLAYSENSGRIGLCFATLDPNTDTWHAISDSPVVKSDFGPWGSHKKMFSPFLKHQGDTLWVVTWVADRNGQVQGTATSRDLIHWSPQIYESAVGLINGASDYVVDGSQVRGNVVKMDAKQLEKLKAFANQRIEREKANAEVMADDTVRFSSLMPLTCKITPRKTLSKKISDKLIGIFFEDINYAADGGLYAELIQNRDFEYSPSDRGNDEGWHALKAWRLPEDNKGTAVISTTHPLHANNPHYLAINAKKGDRLINKGYDGIAVKGGDAYDFSMFARGNMRVDVRLVDADGNVLASKPFDIKAGNFAQISGELVPNADCDSASLEIRALAKGKYDLDMVSLFPRNTFKGRKNGLRADLAQLLADLKPKFVRFPGGCVAHGDGIDNIYDWKGSIGPLQERKPLRNIWGYHQTRGLGYHEYFLFCEDIGAQPLPVLAAGVPCQNSGTAAHHSHGPLTTYGQQCGIPMEEMPAYIQDVLDLIEYANGPADSEWGSKRAAAGHPEPFGLKMIGIGNEDMITEAFEVRYKMIIDSVRARYPEIEVVGTVGPFYEGTDYDEGWRLAREMQIPCVDEHYYVSPGWLINNQDFYDNYQRDATRVYLGEYAAHLPNRASNVETALAEALYLASVERNADVVEMTSYAPLLSKDGHTQWRPDLIYFNNSEVRPSVDYYVQKLYGNYGGDQYLTPRVVLSTRNADAKKRVGVSVVYDSSDDCLIVKVANLLPRGIEGMVDLSAFIVDTATDVEMVGFLGAPADTEAQHYDLRLPLSDAQMMKCAIAPYSFSVFKIKCKTDELARTDK